VLGSSYYNCPPSHSRSSRWSSAPSRKLRKPYLLETMRALSIQQPVPWKREAIEQGVNKFVGEQDREGVLVLLDIRLHQANLVVDIQGDNRDILAVFHTL